LHVARCVEFLFSLASASVSRGALASGYQAMAARPAGFGPLGEGVAPKTFAAVPFLVFAAPLHHHAQHVARRQDRAPLLNS
jgi:hypothetical protein